MSEPSRGRLWVPILVAVIGLVGSLGAAWLATQAKFSQELESKSGDLGKLQMEIVQLKANLDEAQRQLGRQQQEVERKVAAVDDRLRKLDEQIELAKTAATRLANSTFGLFGKKKIE